MNRGAWVLLVATQASHGCAAPAQERATPAAARAKQSAPAPLPPIGASQRLLVLRWANPARVLQERGGRELLQWLLGPLPVHEQTVNASAPIDLVWASDPAADASRFETRLALAFGVRSIAALREDARRSGARVESTSDGALAWQSKGFVCALPETSPEGEARVVCGPARRDVQGLSRYVLGDLGRELPAAADVEAELRLAPLQGLGESELFDVSQALVKPLLNLQSRNQRFDRAGAHLSSEAAREVSLLIRDVERARGELRFAAASLDGVFSLDFRSANSRLLQSLLAQANHAEAAPTRFWRCPPESSSALFVRGIEPADYRAHKELVGTLFGEVLSYQGTPPKLKDLAAELVYAVPLPKGDLVLCAGAGADAHASTKARSLEAQDLALAKQRWGWRVFITGDEPDRYRSYLVKLVEAFQDPVLGPQLRRFIGAQSGETPLSVRARPPAPGMGLPLGTRLVEMTWPARELDPRSGSLVVGRSPGLKLLVTVSPLGRGEGTLIGVGSDEKILAQKLRSIAQRSPAARVRLDQRADLSRLTSTSAIAGGFWNIPSLASGDAGGPMSNPGSALVYTLQVDPRKRRIEARLSVPAAAAADLAALISGPPRAEPESVGSEPR